MQGRRASPVLLAAAGALAVALLGAPLGAGADATPTAKPKPKPKIIRGPRGPRGLRGPAGPRGPQGIQGERGATGPQGQHGTQGATGPQGPTGPQGVGLDRPGFALTTLDRGGGMSVAIGSDGLGLISYRRRNAEGDVALKVAHCSNIACTTATISTLLGDIGGSTSTSIAIGADGLGLISYHDYAQNSVNVAHCSNVVCSEGTISTLDTEVRGEFSSTAIGADGLGLVAYWQDEPGHDDDRIKVAHCSNVACTKATTTTVGPGVAPAITIGGDGLALMSYESGDSLRVAHCLDLGCTTTEMSPIVDDVAALSAITTGSDGLGLISYVVDSGTQLTGVSVAHCEDVACSSATLSPVRAGGRYEEYTSIIVGTDGLAFISYHDVNGPVVGTLRAAHCRNLACTSSSLTTVDGTDDVGASNSTTLGADGLPLIAYVSGNDLGVAHCSNVFCVPYFRRR